MIANGTPVTLRGTTWGRAHAGTAIVMLASGALIAVPLEDLEEQGEGDGRERA